MKSKIYLFLLILSFFILGFLLYQNFIDFISNYFLETNNLINTSPNSHFIDRWLFCLGMAIIPLIIKTFKIKRDIIFAPITLGLIAIFVLSRVYFINNRVENLITFDTSELKIGLFFTLGVISAYLLKILKKTLNKHTSVNRAL
ncbi:hypothetical protein SAMN05421738_1148 [Algoriella xinjiangensis]|uniref:Uncharacterized protein n=1 Tax=Algoriella xinjiangensis TaxID=684065 RepID=A0A1I4ZPH6_9FLAO|nr:hypothetical protein [Algoriella xinjiangensis]SFN51889.1 hypothetical protein SAMN05421738_1148 [Algoriella xinjiangensis]VDH16292.1 Uncharacterised protein [Algoriella xinjiangensis]